ncbi:hypothetical protein M3936_03780 [Sutcliffiella horikoshii]|uniref:hypothetical protein n=1 Tax=Sutcliffiella horikoshii TaxID=79883 RepID=UPI0020417625|nr:hypothetical protein [Sutcliffiella horikoshii]MCM3616697.1 hypothetical protein [Sutcliffiella horikoshii]
MKKNLDIKKGCYIPSIEACDIWEHMNRNKELYYDYTGFVPYSLELLHLYDQKEFNIYQSSRSRNKLQSRDIINVKFDNVVQSAQKKKDTIEKEKIAKNKELALFKGDEEKTNQIKAYIKELDEKIKSIDDKWIGVSKESLRNELYINGFTLHRVDKKTKEVFTEVYRMYKRTSSKSRKGQCLFIKESLLKEMNDWSRMRLKFVEEEPVDLASLSSYSALVSSSIERTLKINPKSILVVDEVISKWNEKNKVNVVKLVEGEVKSVPIEGHEIENSIFDGEILLDKEFFKENESMLLLRHHWSKGAAFSTNLQEFFKDYAKENNEDYETMTVKSMFNEEIPVKQIKLVLNPTCIKFLKMSYLFKQEGENEKEHGLLWQKRIWEHWKGLGDVWGVCKHDKSNRRGSKDGMPLQRLSYQMVNSLEASEKEIAELAKEEVEYIYKLKNDPEVFIEHVVRNRKEVKSEEEKVDMFSSDKMFVDLYNQNQEIIHSTPFKKFKADTIYNYVKDVKKGRIRLSGDYAVLFSCPINYLYHAVNETNIKPMGLKKNEVYTTLFGENNFDEEYTIFRNPHTSASNVWVGRNINVPKIKKYFNLSPNVICINSCEENVMNRLSGCDFDSDSVAIFKNEHLLSLSKKCLEKYNVCINGLEADKTPYTLNLESMAKLDHILARSTTEIGSIVNEGQLFNAIYYDYLHNGKELKDIYEKTDIMTVLSMCSIDSAKRKYDINIGSVLRKVQKVSKSIRDIQFEGAKPNFFQYIDKKDKVTFTHYNTPMDYLYNILSNLDDANGVKTYNIRKVLTKVNVDNANRKQRLKVKEIVEDLVKELESIHSKNYRKKEKNIKVSNVKSEYLCKIGKLKIKPDTMYSILRDIDEDKYKSIKLNLMNCLYYAHKETFLNCFKKSHG